MTATRLLWTGGWDSSFRLLQTLLTERRAVQPIYLIDPERESTLYEVRAMEAIRAGVTPRLEDPSMLAPAEVHVRTEFPVPSEVAERYELLARQIHVGSQYLWLAAAGEALGWQDVEICFTRWENGDGRQRIVFDEHGELNGSRESELFRYYSFPVLQTTKAEMAGIARRGGYYDLLSLRWFCFVPVGGKPCGRCPPCRLTYREGVDFANPVAARVRDTWRYGKVRQARQALRRRAVR
jgi:7-cyano-7-deazaguanine synthase